MNPARDDRVERHVTCLGCGCACDDLEVAVHGGRITAVTPSCARGVGWFGDGSAPARALIDGADTSRDDALAAAARMMAAAERPLVYVTTDLSCEAQRAAVALADHLHAVVDNVSASTVLASVLAAQEIGRATATLGEIRNRADVVVFWDVDPARYPRFAERYVPDGEALYLSGETRRRVVSVSIDREPWPRATHEVRVSAEAEPGALGALSALVSDPSRVPGAGPAWSTAAAVRECIAGGQYVVFVADAEPAGPRPLARADAFCRLSHALNHHARGAVVMLRAGGNRTGAEAAMTSAAGYPLAVDFSTGAPRYRPHDGSARALLAGGVPDAVLVVGDAAVLDGSLREALARIPCAAIGPSATAGPLAEAHVAIDSARAGVHEGGTACRLDDVRLPLRQILAGPPTALSLLTALDGLLPAHSSGTRR